MIERCVGHDFWLETRVVLLRLALLMSPVGRGAPMMQHSVLAHVMSAFVGGLDLHIGAINLPTVAIT